MSKNIVKTKKLGLAAYMKIKGCKLIGCDKGVFTLEAINSASDREWEIEYMNTDCYRHDVEIMHLRKLLL